MRSHSIPEKPWTKVGVDIFTHNVSNYLVITDYLSACFEFEKLSDMTTASVIAISKKSFAMLGSMLGQWSTVYGEIIRKIQRGVGL